MKKICFLLLIVSFFTACNLYNKKTEKIGECTWFTEYGYLDALEKAKKENKPIFVYFTAKWCEPCQKVKEEVFEKKEFKEAEKEVVLLKVEQSEIPGRALCRKYRISVFPSFRLIDKDGKVIDRGWQGYQKGKDIVQWIKDAKKRQNLDFFKKPIPLTQLASYFTPPHAVASGFTDKQRFELLYNSLTFFATNKKGEISNFQFKNLLYDLIYEIPAIEKTIKTQKEKEAFSNKIKNIKALIDKLKNKKEKISVLTTFYLKTNQPEKALTILNSEVKKIKHIESHNDINLLRNQVLAYTILLEKEKSKPQKELGKNLLVNELKENILQSAYRIADYAYLFPNNKQIYSVIFSSLKMITEKLNSQGERELTEKIAAMAFDTLVKTTDISQTDFFKPEDFSKISFEPHSFWLKVYLEEFSDKKLIPKKLLDFSLKNYQKAIGYPKDLLIFSIFQNYFTLGKYKEGMNFIKKILNDKNYKQHLNDKRFGSYYSSYAKVCLEHNVYLEQAEKWAEKADKLTYHKDEYTLFTLARIKAKKGDYNEAINLAKDAYARALYAQHTDEKFIKRIKESIKQWQKKL